MRFVVAALIIAVGLCSAALAGPAGTLDPTFGVGGRALGNQLSFNHLVQAPAGDIIASGASLVTNGRALARYQNDGSLDASFGTGGILEDQGVTSYLDLAIQPDGKILALATESVTFDAIVRRYTATGAVDTSLDGDGSLAVPLALRLAVQPDGKIVAASQVLTANHLDWDILVSRYESSGAPDLTFGSGGSVLTTDVGTKPTINGMVLQPDGGILVTGFFGSYASPGGYLLRYVSAGSLDPSFGTVGKLTESNASRLGSRVALQPDGKILTGGGVTRWDSAGNLDTTFGSGGSIDAGGVMAVQADGKIVVSQAQFLFGSWLQRFTANGGLDTGFGDAGTGEHVGDLDAIDALLVQADGRIVAAIDDRRYFVLERFLGGTCGDAVADGGEECDDGNATPGDGCEPGCCLSDADGDGRCDTQDPCTGAAPTDAVVMFSGLGTWERQRFKVKGTVDFPGPAVLDPLANGVRIVLREQGSYLYDFTLPGGAFASDPGYGWTASGSPARSWKFRGSNLPSPIYVPFFGEVASFKISRQTNTPSRVKFALKTMLIHDYPVSSVTATLVLDPPTATSGNCAELTLPCVATASSVRCRL